MGCAVNMWCFSIKDDILSHFQNMHYNTLHRVSLSWVLLCWVSLCLISFSWVSLCWMSWCHDNQHDDIQHKPKSNATLCIMTDSGYAEGRLFWASQQPFVLTVIELSILCHLVHVSYLIDTKLICQLDIPAHFYCIIYDLIKHSLRGLNYETQAFNKSI